MSTEDKFSVANQLVLLGYIGGQLQLDEPNFYPLKGGRVEIEWCTENRSVLIEICEDGSASIIWSENEDVKQDFENIDPSEFVDQANKALHWISEDAFDWDSAGTL